MEYRRPKPSGALLDLLERDSEIDRIMERGLVFDRPAPRPPPPAPTIREVMAAEPPDWHAEEAERLERERQERARIVADEPDLEGWTAGLGYPGNGSAATNTSTPRSARVRYSPGPPVLIRARRGSSHRRRRENGAHMGTPEGVRASAAMWAPTGRRSARQGGVDEPGDDAGQRGGEGAGERECVGPRCGNRVGQADGQSEEHSGQACERHPTLDPRAAVEACAGEVGVGQQRADPCRADQHSGAGCGGR